MAGKAIHQAVKPTNPLAPLWNKTPPPVRRVMKKALVCIVKPLQRRTCLLLIANVCEIETSSRQKRHQTPKTSPVGDGTTPVWKEFIMYDLFISLFFSKPAKIPLKQQIFSCLEPFHDFDSLLCVNKLYTVVYKFPTQNMQPFFLQQ